MLHTLLAVTLSSCRQHWFSLFFCCCQTHCSNWARINMLMYESGDNVSSRGHFFLKQQCSETMCRRIFALERTDSRDNSFHAVPRSHLERRNSLAPRTTQKPSFSRKTVYFDFSLVLHNWFQCPGHSVPQLL